MQKLTLLILALAVHFVSMAQQELPAYNQAIGIFQRSYGGAPADSLYWMYSVQKKESATVADTRSWLSELKFKYGQIQSVTFLKQDPTFASYKIKFDKGERVLTISLDKTDKILGFLFRPFDPEEFPNAEADEDEKEPSGKKE